MMMKRLLTAGALLAGGAGTAAAQGDLIDWSGPYFGAQIGYSFADGFIQFPEDGAPGEFAWKPDPSGVFVGIHAGYNFQRANGFVWGIETEINVGGGSERVDYIDFFVPTPDVYDGELAVEWSGSTRLRFGYSIGRWLPFVTAGVAYAGYDFRIHQAGNDLPGRDDGTLFGWTAGIGAEYALNEKWTLRAFYNYSDFDIDKFDTYADGSLFAGPLDGDLQIHNLGIGVSYGF